MKNYFLICFLFLGTLAFSQEQEISGTVVDEDYFASTVADAAAMADVRFEAANINTAGKTMWEMAGASADPGGYYYIAATMAAAGGTEGDMSFNIHYVVN